MKNSNLNATEFIGYSLTRKIYNKTKNKITCNNFTNKVD